jgi:acetylornithine deacetylase
MHLAIELLQRLVQSESISGNEAASVRIYAEFAQRCGFTPVIDGRNVWFELRRSAGPALLFNSHLDTVKAGETWRRDPWDGAIEDDRLHGLGANDAKGSVAAQFATAVRLAESGFEGNIVVCASCDEETGGEGLERIARLMPPYDAAVLGEPNDMHVAAAQRGLVKAAIKVPGRRAHASRPWQGHNAIHAAARILGAIDTPDINVPGDLDKPTAQVTVIEGGTQSNVVPDACLMTVDCRTTPAFDNDRMIAHLRAAADAEHGQLIIRSNRFMPVRTDHDAHIVRAALTATGQAEAGVFPSVCDLFWVGHVPGIVMGPGRPERSHQADEFIRITEVLDAIAIYASTANAWWSRVRA